MKHTLIKFKIRQCSSMEISHDSSDPTIQLEILWWSLCLLLYGLFIALLVPRDKQDKSKKKRALGTGGKKGQEDYLLPPCLHLHHPVSRDKRGKRKA